MLRRAVGDDCVVKVKTNILPWEEIAGSREFMAAEDVNRMAEYEVEYEMEVQARWKVIEAELDAHFGLTPDKAPDAIE